MKSNKKGISLIVLVITIILVIVLTSTIVVSMVGRTSKATFAALENDMIQIKDNVLIYYAKNNSYPVISSESYTKDHINTLTNSLYQKSKYKNNFLAQAQYSEDEEFYKLDINKLDIVETKRGNGAKGELDYYLIALPSANIYYMRGEVVEDEVLYSLNYMLGVKNNNIVTEGGTSTTSVIYKSDGVKVSYNKSLTNILGLTIDVNIAENEELYLLFQEEYTKTSTNLKKVDIANIGNNVLRMDDIGKIYSLLDTTSMSTGFVYDDSKPKIMNIIKKKGNDTVAMASVDLNNYDNAKPYIDESTKKIIIGSTENSISFRTDNNIKEVRYDYLKKYDTYSEGIVNYYENINSLDLNYIKQNGKKATVSSDGLVEIKLNKDISDISIVVIDNAGNVSDVYNYNIYGNIPYINAKITDYLFSKFSFDVYIYCIDKISSVTAQISKDNATYDDIKDLTITTQGNVTKASVSFDKLDNSDNVFLKLVVNGNSTRILKYDI